MWDVDYMHPIDPGMAAIADMVAYLLQQTALGLLLSPFSNADRTLLQEQLPDPMFKGESRVFALAVPAPQAHPALPCLAHYVLLLHLSWQVIIPTTTVPASL